MTNTFLDKDKNNEIIAKNFYEFLSGKKTLYYHLIQWQK